MRWFTKVPVLYRIMAIILIAVISLVTQVMMAEIDQREHMVEGRRAELRHLTEVAHKIVEGFEKQAAAGSMSADAAKAAALALLQNLRYEGNEYFWVNDMTPVLLMHPFAPQLVGKDVSTNADPAGKRLFVEFVNVVKASGSGYVDYLWPKPGHDKPVPKISYVKGFAPWGWVIGTGVYVDDLDAAFAASVRDAAVSTGLNGLVLILFAFLLARTVAKPVKDITATILRLAERDWTTEVPHTKDGDEIGAIARSVEVFKQNGQENERLQREADAQRAAIEAQRQAREQREAVAARQIADLVESVAGGRLDSRIREDDKEGFQLTVSRELNRLTAMLQGVTGELASVMRGLAEGQVGQRVSGEYAGVYGELKTAANSMAERLSDFARRLSEASNLLRDSAADISAGSQDLAGRTESQAASLEETAAAMHEVTSTVKQNADNAVAADNLAREARQTAENGGAVVGRVVDAMRAIEGSARKISDIMALIDEIAFQTNLLALNASVEAARAGEAGKGFAVVAQEVRALAQRSASASKEIKSLIAASNAEVKSGTELADQAGGTLHEIVGAVQKVTNIVAEIAAASGEQSRGLDEVNKAVNDMDEITQRNAALVEETHAAAQGLSNQALELAELVSFFKLEGGGGTIEHRRATRIEGGSKDCVTVKGTDYPLRNWSRIGLFFGPINNPPPRGQEFELSVLVHTPRQIFRFPATAEVVRVDGRYVAVRYTCRDEGTAQEIRSHFAD